MLFDINIWIKHEISQTTLLKTNTNAWVVCYGLCVGRLVFLTIYTMEFKTCMRSFRFLFRKSAILLVVLIYKLLKTRCQNTTFKCFYTYNTIMITIILCIVHTNSIYCAYIKICLTYNITNNIRWWKTI